MKHFGFTVALLLAACAPGFSTPLGTAVKNVIPKEAQQIICVDYRVMKASPTAMALKERVMPPNMKEFETALRGQGIDPEKDLESLTFASFRGAKGALQVVGIAQGNFSTQKVLQKFRAKKIRPAKYRSSLIYPSVSGMLMTFVDDYTLMFGNASGLKGALDARDGEIETLSANQQLSDLISGADNGPVWSVLDTAGTQNMMKSALGDAAQLADYEVVKKRLVGSRYAMDFTNGVSFNLDVVTSDTVTAMALSSLVKAGMMYRRVTSNGSEKMALESVSVDSESDRLRVHFKTDEKKFQSLMQTELFAAVSK